MNETLTSSIQDYLKQIFEINENGWPASTTELAERLNIAPASVTGMLQKLAGSSPPLVIYQKYQGVILTPAGRNAALEVIRYHRLLEAYLVQALGYPWDEVHDEACRMEHVISADFAARIEAALGHPQRDPHGALIPDAELSMPSETLRSLTSLQASETVTVQRVDDHDPAKLRRLAQAGVIPAVRLTLLVDCAEDDSLTIQVEGKPEPVRLSLEVARQVFVRP